MCEVLASDRPPFSESLKMCRRLLVSEDYCELWKVRRPGSQIHKDITLLLKLPKARLLELVEGGVVVLKHSWSEMGSE